MRVLFLSLLLLPFCAHAQRRTLSFGAKVDSVGRVFIIQQVVRSSGDSTSTTADAIRFQDAAAALVAVTGLREIITRDSVAVAEMNRENARHRRELDAIQKELKRRANEIELARLRRDAVARGTGEKQ